jgi:hypothetical protein
MMQAFERMQNKGKIDVRSPIWINFHL